MDKTFGRVSSRRHDLDWLRVFGIYMLFPVHVAIVFSPLPFYHIRNSTVSLRMLLFLAFVEPWIMPLFFVMAGWAMFHSLRFRGSRGFLKRRVQKLLIPLVVGCVIFGPPIKYIELRSGFDANYRSLCASSEFQQGFGPCIPAGPPIALPFSEGFFEFWPTFFTRFDRFTWSHLWFLGYLFTFSLLYLPLFRWLMKTRHSFTRAGTAWVYLPMVPLILIEIVLRPHWPGFQNLYDDWANFAYFSTCLIMGFMLAKYPALEQAVQREWKRALGIYLGGMALRVLLGVRVFLGIGGVTSPALWSVSLVVASWGGVVALLGFARHRLAHTNAVLDYLSESAYPVYFLHQAAVVCIGYGIIQLSLRIAVKYVLLLAASFTATMAVYHFVVRPVLRLAFGMKPMAGEVGSAECEHRAFAANIAETSSYPDSTAPATPSWRLDDHPVAGVNLHRHL
jgi:glucan biosynthesis protein C